jgi:hypothetical protein
LPVGPVHFILTAGELRPQYRHGLESARVHGAPIWLWHHEDFDASEAPDYVETYPLKIPDWLANEHPAHICDPLLLQILYEYGGMFLGLDTISLRPALDLLTKELCVSLDVPWEDFVGGERKIDHPFSMHLIAEQGSPLVRELYVEARYRVENLTSKPWGYTGPALLTGPVLSNLDRVDVPPFPTLCGFEGSYIWRWYLGLEKPPPETRVLHLFSSAYPELFAGEKDLWLARNPSFKEYVAGAMTA